MNLREIKVLLLGLSGIEYPDYITGYQLVLKAAKKMVNLKEIENIWKNFMILRTKFYESSSKPSPKNALKEYIQEIQKRNQEHACQRNANLHWKEGENPLN